MKATELISIGAVGIIFKIDREAKRERHERYWHHVPRVGESVDLSPTYQKDPLEVVSVTWRDEEAPGREEEMFRPVVTVYLRERFRG